MVIVTSALGQPSAAVRALRAAGFHASLRDLRAPLEEVALDMPGAVVLELPDDADPARLARELAGPAGMADVPVVAIVGQAHLRAPRGLAGIHDFCVRPLNEDELVVRVRRLVRSQARPEDDTIRVEELTIDLRGYEAAVAGRPLDLTYQEFQLLQFLASHPGQAFSRDQLLARVWGHDYYGGSRTVDIHVRRVRAKLGPVYAGCLRTIRHVGYKWVASTTPSDEDDA
ncbi:MAG: winged-helix domain-containing protein [Myxococcales bacterium]|nr:winged-helix domain-containing protein [Myxococcales bacterium]